MALTNIDLHQIETVMKATIAGHPRFDEMEARLDQVEARIARDMSDQADVMTDAMALIDSRFNAIERRLDNLRIVSH